MFGLRRNKWRDTDPYQRARWAYEGQGAAATRVSLFLGVGFIAALSYAGVAVYDRHELATLGDLKFVAFETNRTTGDFVTVSPIDGKLMVDETKRRQFVRYWISLWRAVPADAVVYNANYLLSQAYMSAAVNSRIAGYMTENPVDKFIQSGRARMVRNVQVTPNGNGTRYRVDWVEFVFQNTRLIAQTPMTADIDLEQHTPRTDAEAEGNMFGLMIKGFYWAPPPDA
jgi:type IV secretory pathway TrbF-like protein